MKRYRMTLLAICLVLGFLGYQDLKTFFNNPEPLPISISELEQSGAPREWLQIQGGSLDLEQAINPSGQIDTFENGPFFVPIVGRNNDGAIRVVVETQLPQVIEILKTYALGFDSEEEQQLFLAKNKAAFHPAYEVTGMTASWLTSTANRDKLLKLAKQQNMPVRDDVIFISEGKKPAKFRGFFFSIIALLGLIKFVQLTIKRQSDLAIDLEGKKP